MDVGLSARDYFRFIKIYSGKSLRETLHNPLWSQVLASAEKLYRKDFGKSAPAIFRRYRV
jgi:heptose I phosphotransferase